jgi:hypothetical protein
VHLEEFYIANNKLTEITGLGALPVLRKLDLGANRFRSIEGTCLPTRPNHHAPIITPHLPRLNRHAPLVTPESSRLNRHASIVTPQSSRLNCHASIATPQSSSRLCRHPLRWTDACRATPQ